jgi:broad specificity phosphatase PhoE
MILLRHGQSEFNVMFSATRQDPGIIDAKLTALGQQQAEAAAEALRDEGITRILASPYTRALQTAEPISQALGLPVAINVLVRERYKFACDIGSHRDDLARDWPHRDFSAIDPVWWPSDEEDAASIVARAESFRAAMTADPEWATTLVISHWGFILAMTNVSMMNGTWLRCDPTAAAPAKLVWKV